MGPAEQVEQQELITLLTTAIDRLPERERLLLSLYYHEELTMKEISKVMGVSESRVCQLHMQAVLRLRAAMNLQQDFEDTTRSKQRHVTTAGGRHSRQKINSIS